MFKFCPHCGNKISGQFKDGFQCLKCQLSTHYLSAPTASVVVKVSNEVLLAIRGIEPSKGLYDFPGGFLKYGEEPLIGAVREFKEETGIDLDPKKLQFLDIWIDTYHYQGQDQYCLNIFYIINFDKKVTGTPAEDVADLIWVPITENPQFSFPYLNRVWDKVKS